MGEFKGTKGEAITYFHYSKKNAYLRTGIKCNIFNSTFTVYEALKGEDECNNLECNCMGEYKFNAELIRDAFNVRQQINFDLPELLEQRNEMLEMLQRINSTLDDLWNRDDTNILFDYLNQIDIQSLIKKATEL